TLRFVSFPHLFPLYLLHFFFFFFFFFFNDPSTTEIYTLSLHDALPILNVSSVQFSSADFLDTVDEVLRQTGLEPGALELELTERSEEHTSELQSPYDLVCRLLLEKKKK